MTCAISVVRAWVEAANAENASRLRDLSSPDIEIIGPRGAGRGSRLLAEWLARAGLHLTTQRAFARDNCVVLEQYGVWRSPETREIVGEGTVASVFEVENGRVAHFARYDTLRMAMEMAGLTETDEVIGEPNGAQ